MTDNIIILAGGASSRMKKSTAQNLTPDKVTQANQLSKGLIELKGKPFLSYLLKHILEAGFKNVFIITGAESDNFRKAFENKAEFEGLKIQFATQFIPEGREKPMGTADALYQCLNEFPHLKESKFCVCNSDNLYSLKALELLKNSTAQQAILAYDIDHLNFSRARISRFAVMRFNADNKLLSIVEKPEENEIQQYTDSSGKIRVSMNIFLFDGQLIFKHLENCPLHPSRNEKELPTALLNMIHDNAVVNGIPIAEHVPDLTSKEDIAVLEKYLGEN
jgi:glucose-1-phosphate adenylyltransferase